ncbi:MAG: hypothetical protein ACPG32_13160 [Akkermansiaceae bacterium]
MKVFVCPRAWTHAKSRFTPTHMVSLQDPGADVSDLRPPWIAAENHHITYLHDLDKPGHDNTPTAEQITPLIEWLTPRCCPNSENKFLIHCDAGLGRSTAVGYIVWAIHLGPGNEHQAFRHMIDSSLESNLVPNSIIIAHADQLLNRNGALKAPLSEWNRRVTWRRTFR